MILRPLSELFDRPVATAYDVPALVDDALYPDERASMARAVPKRRAEFGVGRLCARRALAELGVAPLPILAGEDRAPIWPPGIRGSITHTDTCCAAVVARASDVVSVGIDVEEDAPLKPGLERKICTEAERRWLDAQPADERGRLGMLFFSAKEAFYKCQYPLTRAYLGFLDVELRFRLDCAEFTLEAIRREWASFEPARAARGRFRREEGLILTGVTL